MAGAESYTRRPCANFRQSLSPKRLAKSVVPLTDRAISEPAATLIDLAMDVH
jgi:hypothetical protein